MTVDYDTLDPLVRRDSYQDISSLETGIVQLNVLFFFFIRNSPFLKNFFHFLFLLLGICAVSLTFISQVLTGKQ